jgi:hypothetical protein
MSLSFRRALVVTLVPVITATFVSACSSDNGTSGAIGTGGAADAPVLIAATPRGVTIENRAGRQLLDVSVSIRPGGSAPTFHRTLPSMATAERKELPLTEFKSSENVTLNPMFVRPQEITLTAKDDSGKDYRITVPWK